MVVWTWSGLKACLFWMCIDVIVVRFKVSRGIVPFSPVHICTNKEVSIGTLRLSVLFSLEIFPFVCYVLVELGREGKPKSRLFFSN
jgi:hypothetical protein